MEGNDSADMTTVSSHRFGDDSDDPAFSISIIEKVKEEYGLFVWPCSLVLAEYVWQQRLRFSGAGVIEVVTSALILIQLGAGTSLPGLVATKVGADVTLTDDSSRLQVLNNMRRMLDFNKLKCNVMGLTWEAWDASTFCLHPEFILALMYCMMLVVGFFLPVLSVTELKPQLDFILLAFDDLFATVTFLLQNSPGSVFITTYHNRSGHHLIEFLMVKWGLKCAKLLDAFSFMPSYKASGLSGNLQLAEIVLDSERAGTTELH